MKLMVVGRPLDPWAPDSDKQPQKHDDECECKWDTGKVSHTERGWEPVQWEPIWLTERERRDFPGMPYKEGVAKQPQFAYHGLPWKESAGKWVFGFMLLRWESVPSQITPQTLLPPLEPWKVPVFLNQFHLFRLLFCILLTFFPITVINCMSYMFISVTLQLLLLLLLIIIFTNINIMKYHFQQK